MKKFLAVLAIAGTLVACNNAAESEDNAKDSLDSIAAEKKEAVDSTAEVKKEVIDSTTEQKKEALDRQDSLNRRDTIKK